MLELTKKPRTDGLVEVRAIVPANRAEAVTRAIEEAVQPNVPAREVFPESTPGSVLRGARRLRELTQAELAAR
ncbi:XRE family transcriptional regulator, partial [Desulfocurvibacter africanus]|uniref:XRE family transcriptional regulator n=1 Tax=Desulfocurvibacter africanus TaxID=873 RepID=UPI002FD8B642